MGMDSKYLIHSYLPLRDTAGVAVAVDYAKGVASSVSALISWGGTPPIASLPCRSFPLPQSVECSRVHWSMGSVASLSSCFAPCGGC